MKLFIIFTFQLGSEQPLTFTASHQPFEKSMRFEYFTILPLEIDNSKPKAPNFLAWHFVPKRALKASLAPSMMNVRFQKRM